MNLPLVTVVLAKSSIIEPVHEISILMPLISKSYANVSREARRLKFGSGLRLYDGSDVKL